MPTESEETHESSNVDESRSVNPDAVDLDYASRASPYVHVSNGPPGRLDWAVIGVRLVALWCFFAAIPGVFLLAVIFNDSREMTLTYRMLTILPYCAYAIVGVIVWMVAGSVGRRMLADVPTTELANSESSPAESRPADAQAVAFSVAGVVFTALALRHLPEAFMAFSRRSQSQYVEGYSTTVDRMVLIQIAVELAVGIGLFLGARGLANLWRRVTLTGHHPSNPAAGNASENDSAPQ